MNNNNQPGPFSGNVVFAGTTIATWQLTWNAPYVDFNGNNADTSVTTTSGTAIGIDINGNSPSDDGWDVTLAVNPIAGTPYDITGIRVLGSNLIETATTAHSKTPPEMFLHYGYKLR